MRSTCENRARLPPSATSVAIREKLEFRSRCLRRSRQIVQRAKTHEKPLDACNKTTTFRLAKCDISACEAVPLANQDLRGSKTMYDLETWDQRRVASI